MSNHFKREFRLANFLIIIQFLNLYFGQDHTQVLAVSIGEEWPWPHPQSFNIPTTTNLALNPKTFKIVSNLNCTVINSAIERYRKGLIFYAGKNVTTGSAGTGFLSRLQIRVTGGSNNTCAQFPSFDMDESYTLEINTKKLPSKAQLSSRSEWGILRGLETFSQLIWYSSDTRNYYVRSASINDYPRFKHRGLMIDTSRHFIPIPTLKSLLDGMSYNKLNVFHWHMTDDESFSYGSNKFPELAQSGASAPDEIYWEHDVLELINHGRLLGIRIIPEFGTPAHMTSWGNGREDILTTTPCDGGRLFNVAHEKSYSFLQNFFGEISTLFPDSYWHFGGDEVNPTCWMEDEETVNFKERSNFTDYEQLEEYHYKRLVGIAKKYSKAFLFWEDPIGEDKNGLQLDSSSIIQVWKPMADPLKWKSNAERIAKLSYKMILSAPWYISHYPEPYNEILKQWYDIEPTSFTTNTTLANRMIGGEGAIWTEEIDFRNISRIAWPSMAIVAEKLWSSKQVTGWERMKPRFAEQRCRMGMRGIDLADIGGDFDNEC